MKLNVIAYEFFQLRNIGVWRQNAIGMGVPRDQQGNLAGYFTLVKQDNSHCGPGCNGPLNRPWAPKAGVFFSFPTFQSEGKSMIASNFPAFAAKGIFDLHGGIYAGSGWGLSSVPFPARETGHGVNDDVALVTAVLQRDRKATAEFVNTYTDTVYSFIRRRLSPRHDLVDDLVQEVFIAAWENLNSSVAHPRCRLGCLASHAIKSRITIAGFFRQRSHSILP